MKTYCIMKNVLYGIIATVSVLTIEKENLEVLSSAVQEKIDKVKEVKEQIQDTDLTLKLGKTVLFTIKF